MKQPHLEELRQSLRSNDPLNIVNRFIVGDLEANPLPDYWQHRICALAELIVEMRNQIESERDSEITKAAAFLDAYYFASEKVPEKVLPQCDLEQVPVQHLTTAREILNGDGPRHDSIVEMRKCVDDIKSRGCYCIDEMGI